MTNPPDVIAAAVPSLDPPPTVRADLTRRYSSLDRALFAPAMLMSALILVLSGLASGGVPLHKVLTPVAWGFTALLVFLCSRMPRRTARQMSLLCLGASLAAWLTLITFAGRLLPAPGDLLSQHPDTWSYQALSDYLEHYSRGRLARIPMVDAFGAGLTGSRFATAGLLAFLHTLPMLRDIAMTHLAFISFCLITCFFSMLAWGRALVFYENWRMPLLAAFLATAGGWIRDAMELSNNDNVILIALCPALLALMSNLLERTPVMRWPTVLSAALLFGALLEAYPEGIALMGVLGAPFALFALLGSRDRQRLRQVWTSVLLIGGIGLLLAGPYLPTFFLFLHNQISVANSVPAGSRPGEGVFTGLLDSHRLPASFALGEELRGSSYHLINNFVPLAMLALLVLGLWSLGRRHRWYPWVAVPFLLLLAWQNISKHYDYGTFKILICSTWWIYPAISAGLFWVSARFARPLAWGVGLTAFLLLGIGAEKYEERSETPPLADADRVQALNELRTIHFVTGDAPVLLALDDAMDHLWATYFLRGLPLATWQQQGYLGMPHVKPLLDQAGGPAPSDCQYMLVTGVKPDAVWHNARFSVMRRNDLFIDEIQNPPNGVEKMGDLRYFWLGTQPATLTIITPAAGAYSLRATAWGVGPSLPGLAEASVEVTDTEGSRTVAVGAATQAIPLTLAAGKNTVTLRCLGTPEPGLHNGDPRELMVGIKGPGVERAAPDPAP